MMRINRIPKVSPLGLDKPLPFYDVVFAAVGFERRARFISEHFGLAGSKLYALAFTDRRLHSFKKNFEWFKGNDFSVEAVEDSLFNEWCRGVFNDLFANNNNALKICIDISSMSRFRLAVLVDFARKFRGDAVIEVDFLYSIARYTPPPRRVVPNVHVGPVTPSFAGWSLEPEQPPTAIVGLGYEQNKALGAVEHIQATDVWAFVPISDIEEYKISLDRANRILLDSIPSERRIDYRVEVPFDCFVLLESLVYRSLQTSTPVILPFGPKIFALIAMLVSCVHEQVPVWRVSAGGNEEAKDRIPSELACGLRAEFMPDLL